VGTLRGVHPVVRLEYSTRRRKEEEKKLRGQGVGCQGIGGKKSCYIRRHPARGGLVVLDAEERGNNNN